MLLSNVPNYLGHGVSDEIPGYSYCYAKDIHGGEGVLTLGEATSIFTLTSKAPPLCSTLNFDADVKNHCA